jgi:hypothetical protein
MVAGSAQMIAIMKLTQVTTKNQQKCHNCHFFLASVYGAHRRSRRSGLSTETSVWRRFSRTHLTALITLSGTASK